jgi:hypothetical protein
MAEHEPSVGMSDDWFTPPEIFAALGLRFDLDPCSPGPDHWVPADKIYTKADDGLMQPWFGLVFMNPPFGGRRGHVPWLKRFFGHADGVAIVRAYIGPDGSIGAAPGHGVALIGVGEIANNALMRSGLWLCIRLRGHSTTLKKVAL